jgi:hypothetical protein
MNLRMRSPLLFIFIALSSISSLAEADVPNLKNLQLNLDDIDPADHAAIRKVYDKALPLAANPSVPYLESGST